MIEQNRPETTRASSSSRYVNWLGECRARAQTIGGRVRPKMTYLFPPLALALFWGAWELIVRLGGYPSFILPSP